MPLRVNCLLKVLDLLADLLELGFAKDDVLRNGGVVRFRAERVQLAENLLRDEFERAADRLILCSSAARIARDGFRAASVLRKHRSDRRRARLP